MLKRYWLNIYSTKLKGPKNLSVTAFSIDHAKSLAISELTKSGCKDFSEDEIENAEFIEDIDIRMLDQNHVTLNIGVVSRQGVWFPNLNS